MDISLFDYKLPKEFIAQEPIEPRDNSRLLILDRKTKNIEHQIDKCNFKTLNDDIYTFPSAFWDA